MTSAITATRFGLLTALALLVNTACSKNDKTTPATIGADSGATKGAASDAISENRRVLQGDEKNVGANARLGLAYVERGDLTQGYHYLLKAKSLEPNDRDARLGLAHTYLVIARQDDAREQAEFLLSKNPQDLDALVALAAGSMNADDLADATKRLLGAKPQFGTADRPRLALANLYFRNADSAGAVRILQDAASTDLRSPASHYLLADYYAARHDQAQADRERKLFTGSEAARLATANTLIAVGGRDAAKRLLGEIEDASAGSSDAKKLFAELSLADNAVDQSAKAIGELTDSSDVDALVLAAKLNLARQRPGDAYQNLRRANSLAPTIAPVHYALGLAQIQFANLSAKPSTDSALKSAAAHLSYAIKLAPLYPEAVMQLATLKIQAGAPRAAISDLERLIDADPASTSARIVLGANLVAVGRTVEAGEEFQRIIKTRPANAQAHYWLGMLLARQGKMIEAKPELENALRLAPGFSDAAAQLVSIEMSEGHVDAAVNRLTKQIQLAPQSAALYSLLGVVSVMKNDQAAAEAAFLNATKLDPNLIDAQVRLAELYTASGRYDQAIAHAEVGTRVAPRNSRAILALASALQLKGDSKAARQAYERALVINPKDATAANNLAVLLSGQPGELDAALKYSRLASEISPDDPHVADTLGWILYQRGQYDQAVKLLRVSATRLPESPTVQFHLGASAQKVGDTATARRALTKAVNSSSSFAEKNQALKALADMK